MVLDLNGLFLNKKHSVGAKENISITTMVIGADGAIHGNGTKNLFRSWALKTVLLDVGYLYTPWTPEPLR